VFTMVALADEGRPRAVPAARVGQPRNEGSAIFGNPRCYAQRPQ